MLTKGQRTRRTIVAQAARVFNRRGFAGTSMADILDATGLEKGGVYRHFASKDELALASFDYACEVLKRRHRVAVERAATPYAAIVAWIDVVEASVHSPAIAGGCPILNTATEADDTHPALRSRAAAAMREWQAALAALVAAAIDAGELRPLHVPATVAAIVVSSLEGAIMTTMLLRDRTQMRDVAAHLRGWLDAMRPVPVAA